MLRLVGRNTPIGVYEEIAGRHVVPLALLKAKLGFGAFHVWQVLCRFRDRNGYTHITAAGIARAKGFVKTSPHVVKDALAKLQVAGLVEPVGRRVRRVPTRLGEADVLVYERRVRGACLPHIDGEERVVIPDATKKWGMTAASWGGKRKGAGRRAKESSTPAALESSTPTYKREESKRVREGELSFASQRKDSGARNERAPAAYSLLHTEGNPMSEEKAEGLPQIVGARRHPTRLLSTPITGLPPYPGASLIEVPRVPQPPLLLETDGPEDHAKILATLFRNCVEKRYAIRCFLFRKGDIKRSKHYAKLVEFAKLLIAHEIPPAAWIGWRVDEWLANRKGDRPQLPPVAYVFNVRTITETRWRFREVYEDGQIGGRMLFTKSHRELLRRFQLLHAAINRGADKAKALARYFPDDLWDVLLDAARCESADARQDFARRLKRGEFLW